MSISLPRISVEKALLISALYISQSVPVSFIKTGFQVFLKNQGIAYDSISKLLGLLLLPWALKFLWAPLVDRIGSKKFGHRKSWIFPMQIGGALILSVIAFMDLESQLMEVFLLFMFYSFLCATQDIAVDGLAVLSLSKKQHGIGNSMQMGGYYLGELLGGAVILVIFEMFGWTASILTLAAFYLIPLIPLWRYKESKPETSAERIGLKSIVAYFKREQGVWIVLLFFYMGNQILARTLLPSLLADRNFSESEIGYVIGVFGNSASILGAVLGGLFIESIGRKRSLLIYGLIKIPLFFLLLIIPDTSVSNTWVIGAILSNDFAAGLATVALFTVMMDKCSQSAPGTDFTIQQSLNSVGVLIFVILSGILKATLGYASLLFVAATLGIISVFMVLYLRFDKEDEIEQLDPH